MQQALVIQGHAMIDNDETKAWILRETIQKWGPRRKNQNSDALSFKCPFWWEKSFQSVEIACI